MCKENIPIFLHSQSTIRFLSFGNNFLLADFIISDVWCEIYNVGGTFGTRQNVNIRRKLNT